MNAPLQNIILAAALFGATSLQAGTNTLAVDAVVTEVLAHNPALQGARSRWESMRERVPQARSWEDPTASFDTSAGRFVSVPANSFTDQKFMVEQKIPWGGKRALRGQAAEIEARMAFEEFRRRRLDLATQARVSVFQLANAQAQLEVNRQTTKLLEQAATLARSKYEAGRQSQADLLTAEIELSKLSEAAVDLRLREANAETRLNVLMNRRPGTAVDPPPAMEFTPIDFSLAQLETLIAEQRPEIRVAGQKIEAARARVELARKEKTSDPSVRIEADRYNGAGQPISEITAGISVPLPWFNRRKYDAAIRENQLLQETAEHELASIRADSLGRLRDQLNQIEALHHHVDLSRSRLLPLARQTARSRQINYESDKGSFADWLIAQQSVRELETMYWTHLADYHSAIAELESIVGGPLSTKETK